MSWAIWITGRPGSGKSVLARAAAAKLEALGEPVRVLELDEIRKTLTPSPTYTDAERDVVYRALGFMAALLSEAGVPVVIDATAHRRIWRDLARAAIPRFAEVQLVCPPEVCRERERTRPQGHAPRGIYARAGRPGATVPGVDVPYEPALAPELVIDTAREGVTQAARRVVAVARALAPARLARTAQASTGWAIWITGRPGSGKTTLAERVVILDATAPRRAWRAAARELIPCFAEVQLVCPTEICVERERVSRWHLGAEQRERAAASDLAASPDIAVEYEESLRPELVLHTHMHDLWSTVEQILFLIHGLRPMAVGRLEQPQ